MIDPWLKQHLVCPRTRQPLEWHEDYLISSAGYKYPLFDGVPIMLLEEYEDTNPIRFETTREQLADPLSMLPDPGLGKDEIDPYVSEHIAATCGKLYRPLQNTMTRYPIPELKLPPGEGKLLLDIGCGWGRWSLAAAQKDYQPIGIDPSIDRVRVSRRVARQMGLDASFLVADARCLPFADGSFDVVFSYSVLQHFSREDVRLVLAEVQRTLALDGGISMIQMATRWGGRNLMNQLKQKFRKPNPFKVRFWPQRTLRRTFTDLIGPTTIIVDGFFTLNAQSFDLDLLPWRYRCVVHTSDRLRSLSKLAPWIGCFADSVYVQSEPKKRAPATKSNSGS